MTLKISFFKLLKEDLKRRSWLAAIIMLIIFICQPVALLMSIDGYMSGIEAGYMTLAQVKEYYSSFMEIGGYGMLLLVMGFAVICGISGFSYLHSKVKLDFYHSLAIKRSRLFFVQYLSGILMLAVPYLLSLFMCLAIGGINGLLSSAVVTASFQAYLFRMLSFLGVYGIAILATVLTGKIITAVLGTGVFIIYGTMVIGVGIGLCNQFFHTFVDSGIWKEIMNYTSPAILCVMEEALISGGRFASANDNTLRICLNMGAIILETLVITGLALWAHNSRKSEAAGKALAFKKSENVIKILLVIPMSLLIGLYLAAMMMNNTGVWLFGGIIAGVLILSAVIEFIYHTNMREIFAHKLQLLIVGIAAITIAGIFKFDLFQYDSYIPAKEKVEKMSVYENRLNGNFVYQVNKDGSRIAYDSFSAIDATFTDDIDAFYELAEAGAAGEGNAEGNSITIGYLLKNGKKVYRTYSVEEEILREKMNRILSDVSYKEQLFPIYGKSADQIRSISLDGAIGTSLLDFNKDERSEFLEIYKEELRNADYDDAVKNVVTWLSFEYHIGNGSYTDDRYPVGKSFTKTIEYLTGKAGKEIGVELTAEDIFEIEIDGFNSNGGEADHQVYRDKGDIEEILESVVSGFERNTASSDFEVADYNIFITLNNGAGSNDYHFSLNDIPACVEKDFGSN